MNVNKVYELLVYLISVFFVLSQGVSAKELRVADFDNLASACPVSLIGKSVLDFEGLGNEEVIDEYYNAGMGGNGSGPGLDCSVSFGMQAVAVIDEDAGGSGIISHEPSPDAALFFNQSQAFLNHADGFGTGFSFYYSAISSPGIVTVYDDLDATGNVLARLLLPVTDQISGDPNGGYGPFLPAGVTFSGIAKSVDFGATSEQIAFDNLTFDSSVASAVSLTVPQIKQYNCEQARALVSVVSADGLAINGLDESNFSVWEGQSEKNITVSPWPIMATGYNLGVSLLIDYDENQATADIQAIKAVASSLPGNLNSEDKVAVYDLGSNVSLIQDFTSVPIDAINAINSTTSLGGVRLYDGLVAAAGHAVNAGTYRDAIVLLTDSEDSLSSASLHDAISAANNVNIPVYIVGLNNVDASALEEIALKTSGVFHRAISISDLALKLQLIASGLSGGYLLEWENTDLTDAREVHVLVNTALGNSANTFWYRGCFGAVDQIDVIVNSKGLTGWYQSGDTAWLIQKTTTLVDNAAMRSGLVGDSQSSNISGTFSGKGVISFDWKVSSERDQDFLEVYIDDVLMDRISGDVDWTTESFQVDADGQHTISWRYKKNSAGSAGDDLGLIDNVMFVAACDPGSHVNLGPDFIFDSPFSCSTTGIIRLLGEGLITDGGDLDLSGSKIIIHEGFKIGTQGKLTVRNIAQAISQ